MRVTGQSPSPVHQGRQQVQVGGIRCFDWKESINLGQFLGSQGHPADPDVVIAAGPVEDLLELLEVGLTTPLAAVEIVSLMSILEEATDPLECKIVSSGWQGLARNTSKPSAGGRVTGLILAQARTSTWLTPPL
jgi:hypothetical protein